MNDVALSFHIAILCWAINPSLEYSHVRQFQKKDCSHSQLESEGLSFVLRYITTDGNESTSQFDKDEPNIDLSNKNIVEFDVSQLIGRKDT